MAMPTRTETSAGGIVFRPRESGTRVTGGYEVVLILTHEGRWQLPKGWIEDGEAPEETAHREVREEAGVHAEIVGPLDRIEYWYKSTYDPEPVRVHKFVHMFLLRYIAGSVDDHDDEVQDARWFDIAEAEQRLAFKDEKRMMAMAREALASVSGETRP